MEYINGQGKIHTHIKFIVWTIISKNYLKYKKGIKNGFWNRGSQKTDRIIKTTIAGKVKIQLQQRDSQTCHKNIKLDSWSNFEKYNKD